MSKQVGDESRANSISTSVASLPRQGSGASSDRIPTVVPPRGSHAVNVANLWPDAQQQTKKSFTSQPAVSPFAPEPHTGAEAIVSARTGSIGNGTMVAADGNVHYESSARPLVTLPSCCEGAVGLQIPELIQGHVANVTLPSRLALLGRQSYETMAALQPINLGNSVLGFAPVWGRKVRTDLFVLPWIFSKGGARIWLFLRLLLFLVFLVFFFQFAQVWDLNIGRAWFFGSSIAIFVMYRLALIRRAPDGVMAFCRTMGAPETEEYMFSYSWKVEPEAIRTLAKAMWNNNVGVWIDVVKLTPGDEIRPMVRTMMNRVYRVVVFLSPAYLASPNCCVELHEAVQWPEKCVFCILEPVPAFADFLSDLQSKGATVVDGLHALIGQLDLEVCDVNDSSAWQWWRKQKISGGGVPSHVVPTYWHTIPKCTVSGRVAVPLRSLTAGPAFLTGDCSDAGLRFLPPYLFLLAIVAVVSNFVDLYYTFRHNDCYVTEGTATFRNSSECHSNVDYLWLGIIALCNLAPFTAWGSLFETRTEVHPGLRPLLASKSINGGVKITIRGHDTDPIVANLNKFLTQIGHNAQNSPVTTGSDSASPVAGVVVPDGSPRKRLPSLPSLGLSEVPRQRQTGLAAGFSQSITVYVMHDFVQRDALFGSDDFPFDQRTSLFVWSDPSGDPFTKDAIGERLMRFLVLVAAWDKQLLAENLFSAIGVRVVDMLHSADVESVSPRPSPSP